MEPLPTCLAGRCGSSSASANKPKEKADQDYEKRRDDPLGVVPADVTFVFVTPRRWPGAAAWASARRAERVFSGVRVLDADDLEGWLRAPPRPFTTGSPSFLDAIRATQKRSNSGGPVPKHGLTPLCPLRCFSPDEIRNASSSGSS